MELVGRGRLQAVNYSKKIMVPLTPQFFFNIAEAVLYGF